MARRRVGLLGVSVAALAAQAAVILWRQSPLVRSDAGPGGDLRIALAWTAAGLAAAWIAERKGVSSLALWIGGGFWLWLAGLLWLQALAGKPWL